MFIKRSRDDELAAVALELLKDAAAPAFAPAHIPSPELTLKQEADEFAAMARKQFLSKKRREEQASSTKESGAG